MNKILQFEGKFLQFKILTHFTPVFLRPLLFFKMWTFFCFCFFKYVHSCINCGYLYKAEDVNKYKMIFFQKTTSIIGQTLLIKMVNVLSYM